MTFADLRLLRYGHFTDTKLDFDPTIPFNVIYGPNEAGKSTALRAISGLLFGIPPRTEDAFLHTMAELRIGATLLRSDGDVKLLFRRKGIKNTLLDDAEKPTDDSWLLSVLGGINEAVFHTRFSLSHESLLRGGDELLKGEGDLAEALFQASTGITGLRKALAELDTEAEKLFKSRQGAALIGRALDEFKNARKSIQDLSITAKLWNEASQSQINKEVELRSTKQSISDLGTSKERLSRIKLAFPDIGRRAQLIEDLASLGTVVFLPEAAAQEREECERRAGEGAKAKERAEAKLIQLRTDQSTLGLRTEILERSGSITALHQRLDTYSNAFHDLPSIRLQAKQKIDRARTLMGEVRPGLELKDAMRLRLTTIQRSRIQTLAVTGPVLQDRVRKSSEIAKKLGKDTLDQKAIIAEGPILPNYTELEQAIKRAHQQGDLGRMLRDEVGALKEAEAAAVASVSRLPLWTGTLPELEQTPVPSVETIARFELLFGELHKEQLRLDEEGASNQKRTGEAERSLRTLNIGGLVPTEAELSDARFHREEGWQYVRDAWRHGTSESVIEERFDSSRPLVEAYTESIKVTDEIADRLRREAERVAALAALLADVEDCAARQKGIEDKQNNLRLRLSDLMSEWNTVWKATGIAPLTPAEMRSWHSQHNTLMNQAASIGQLKNKIDSINGRINLHLAELNQSLRGVRASLTTSEHFDDVLFGAEEVLDRLKTTKQNYDRVQSEIERAETEREDAANEHQVAVSQLDSWREDWMHATLPLSLESFLDPEDVSALLNRLDELFNCLEQADLFGDRVESMEDVVSNFSKDATTLSEALAPELSGLASEDTVSRLYSLLLDAGSADATQKEKARQIEEQQYELQAAEAKMADAESDIAVLLKRAECADLLALADTEKRSKKHLELTDELTKVNHSLLTFCAGSTVEELAEEVSKIDADELPGRIEDFDAEILLLENRRTQLVEELALGRAELEEMDGSDEAAAAAEKAQIALATARTHAEHFVDLRLASVVLRRHIERHREQHQDPILKRASQIFPILTLGSFNGLRTDFDDKDRPVLIGVRASGETVQVTGMSDGTRDQLHLALRLASLEQQLNVGEPLPFVLDDLLIHFDDNRASAALTQIAEVARRTQILFFTHHERLVDLAKKVVPNQILRVHRL